VNIFPLLDPDLSFDEALEMHKGSADQHHHACLVNSSSSKEDLVEDDGNIVIDAVPSRKQTLINLQEEYTSIMPFVPSPEVLSKLVHKAA
jgi:hypothetical protein